MVFTFLGLDETSQILQPWDLFLKSVSLKSVSNVLTLWQRPVLDSSENQVVELDFPISYNSIVGCCNGLVCLVRNIQFVLWNPSTRIYKKLPHLDDLDDNDDYGHNCAFDSCGFGWDESSGDYKVFATATVTAGVRHTMAIAMMYSLKHDSWKEVKGWDSWKKTHGIGIGRDKMRMGMLASGSLHWERCDR
ncbi:F-box/kelch-repeat protein At3g23880-like [Salvia miltiorrhiza]|uniref:F-box/kelch-repeat protein At3g23880-like n=1 Tax=Salvia miltiorrhiza TaxID=226208 RepID=UPI0025ACDA92|nr:F-box/kelch-repeat protein At3g23880-like [Salvia miltiorrhiza]